MRSQISEQERKELTYSLIDITREYRYLLNSNKRHVSNKRFPDDYSYMQTYDDTANQRQQLLNKIGQIKAQLGIIDEVSEDFDSEPKSCCNLL